MVGDNVPKILAARDDYDVRTAEVRYLTIDSTKNQLKEFLSGGGTVTVSKIGDNTDKEIVEIAHNIGYQPLFHGWFRKAGENEWHKIPDVVVVNVEGTDVSFGCGISRPTLNMIQICFYTADPFYPDYSEQFEYKYIIYIDPYKNAWSS